MLEQIKTEIKPDTNNKFDELFYIVFQLGNVFLLLSLQPLDSKFGKELLMVSRLLQL